MLKTYFSPTLNTAAFTLRAVLCGTALLQAAQYCAVLRGTARHCAVLRSAAQYCAALRRNKFMFIYAY